MPSLTASLKLGTGSASSLIKSASSLQTQLANYQDQIQALDYANSAYTDEAYSSYSAYLQGRIKSLQATGSIANASKALTLTKTMESAMKSNVSGSILRENIQVLAGNASLSDKYNLIVNQYSRAVNNGDLTLAQSLEKQAYDVNQSIQFQAQQAMDAQATLARAGGSSSGGGSRSSSGTSGVTYQGEVVSNLQEGLKYLNSLAQNTSEKELNARLGDYVKQAAPALQALGVNVSQTQPNYFDVVYGVAGAIYNASVLKAQAEAPINPLLSQTYATQAAEFLNGGTKFDTLAGKLTVQEIQQAQQDPNMFTYDNTNGKYVRDIQSGYQYMTFTDASGDQTQQLVPQYSAFADTSSGKKAFEKVQFLTPTETTQMTKLGLNFTENKSGTTGEGVQVSVTQNTPDFLRKVLGDKGIANMFTDQNGFLTFKAGASSGSGDTFYTLAQDNKGLGGLFEHLPDGSVKLAGGAYGFAADAVNLLVNRGQQVQYQVQVAQAAAQAKLQLAQQQAAAQLHAQQAQAQRNLQVQRAPSPQPPPHASTGVAHYLQPAAPPTMPTYNPQGNNVNPQPAGSGLGLQGGGVNGFNLNQSGSGGIRLR